MKASNMNSDHSPVPMSQQTWIKMGRIYRRFPFLGNKNLMRVLFFMLIAAFSVLMATLKEPCTCGDQVTDEQLRSKAAQGDSAVLAYMKSVDDAFICEFKRQALLKELERKKQHRK